MKLGLTLPQGCDREYLGMDAATAWRRTVEVAQWAEDLGFESLWVYDHMQVDPPPEEAPIFEPFAELAALAAETRRARLGHLVLAASYRNAGLTAKGISTIDVISGGRAILGIGAGWKEDEWLAYGYGFPPAGERLAVLADQLEIITRMLGPGRATFEGTHAHVRDAIHEPKGLQQPRIPILVGGNGPKVTWRLAARFADELNLDALPPDAGRGGAARHRASGARRSGAIRRRSRCRSTSGARPERSRRARNAASDCATTRISACTGSIVQGFAVAKDPRAIDDVIDDAMAVGLLGEAVSPA